MNVDFNIDTYEYLKQRAISEGKSIPALVKQIIKTEQLKQEGINNHEKQAPSIETI